jgi:hypothetical protein
MLFCIGSLMILLAPNLPANLVDKKHNKIVAYICKRFYLDN